MPRILFPLSPETFQENMYYNYPMVPYGETLRIFFLMSFGYHILKTVEQVLAPVKRNDHIEMMLHHGLTVMLIAGSYLVNSVEIGVIVVYVHDMADMFGHFGKGFSETHFKKVKYFNAVSMWGGWLYSRLIVFPYTVYRGVLCIPYTKPFAPVFIGSDAEMLNNLLTGFLFFLFLLNIWWFYLITIMIWRFATQGGVSEDI